MLWLSESYLLTQLTSLTAEYLRMSARKRNAGRKDKTWRYLRFTGTFYYAYDNIPDKAPAHYRSALPSVEELSKMFKAGVESCTRSTLRTTIMEALTDGYYSYLPEYYGYKEEQRNALAQACAVLVALSDRITERDWRKSVFFQEAGYFILHLQVRYLPASWRNLKEKLHRLCAGTPVSELVVLPRKGNQNALKIEDAELVSWLMQLRSMPHNYTNSHIIRKVEQLCELTGKQTPSRSWMEQKLSSAEWKYLSAQARWGKRGRLVQSYQAHLPAANAVFAGDCWQADGTRVNFLPFRDEDGREKFLYQVAIRDVYSGDCLAVHFCLTEDRWAYMEVLREAVRQTGYLPYELVVDRFPGHKTAEWEKTVSQLKNLGVKVTYTHKATGKAQIERWFETLQSVFFQESPYYYGEGVKSTKAAAHRSPEYLAKMKSLAKADGWTMQMAIYEASNAVKSYRETRLSTYSRKHKTVDQSPQQLHEDSDKPHVVRPTAWQVAMLFGIRKEVTMRHEGQLRCELDSLELIYRMDEWDVIKNKHRQKVEFFIDPNDLERAYVIDTNTETLLCVAKQWHRPQIYGPDKEVKYFGKEKKRNNELAGRKSRMVEALITGGSEVELLLGGLGQKGEAEAAESLLTIERFSGIDVPAADQDDQIGPDDLADIVRGMY